MNTAGLGGIGGPFRLDIGQMVHQIPDWQKQAIEIPDDVSALKARSYCLSEFLSPQWISRYKIRIAYFHPHKGELV